MKQHYLHIFTLALIVTLTIILQPLTSYSQSMGNGQDGSPNISGIINSYAALTKDAQPCNDTLNVTNTDEFKADDLILIIQMQGATIDGTNTDTYGTILNYNNAGNYEFSEIKSVLNNKALLLKYSLLRTYTAKGSVQIVRVPQYKSPTITGTLTCSEWDGKTGGVLVLAAQETIYLEKTISVIGKGFKGAQHYTAPCIFAVRYDYIAESPDPRYYALKGEGIAFYGIPDYTSGRGAPANGGGGGNIHTTGGGGGANYGCGGDGGWGYPVDKSGGDTLVYGLGGHAITYSNADNKVFMGGGGGSGHEHYGNGTSGANGGGIVIIAAKAIAGNAKAIYAQGNNSAGGGAYGDGVGGAGAGGSVLLAVENVISKLTIDISGGSGGSTISIGFGPGGGGGGGLCWLNATTIPDSIIINLSGGKRGLARGKVYGGANGCDGGVKTGLSILNNVTYPVVHSNFDMAPDYLSYQNTTYTNSNTVTFTNSSIGGTSTHWDFGDALTDTSYHSQHSYQSTGIFTIQLVERNAMCSDSTIKIISTELKMPDVFTPNGDNQNDVFPAITINNVFSFTIFNKWGQEVFKGDINKYEWDGTYQNQRLPEGTYFYVLELMDADSSEKIVTKGTVMLLR